MATRHRRQASFEGIVNFSDLPPLTSAQRTQGTLRLYRILDHFRPFETNPGNGTSYNRTFLLQYTFEYARSQTSKDNFLKVFFDSIRIPLDGEGDLDYDGLSDDYYGLAEYLMDSFFKPLKASGCKTAQPTPKFDSAVQKLQAGHLTIGTPERMATLRGACLVRDKHRCVITRAYDLEEMRRKEKAHMPMVDDDNVPFTSNSRDKLEVAHILPHSLAQANSDTDLELTDAKKTVLNILNMFDSGVVPIIEGVDIDRPFNAISLTSSMHVSFGAFDIFFEPAVGPGFNDPEYDLGPGHGYSHDHTYKISTFLPMTFQGVLPVTRTLFGTDGAIDMPSRRLLALHWAIAHILHLSGAGAYIDRLLRDMEFLGAHADGSTRLDEMVKLRLDGWWDGAVRG